MQAVGNHEMDYGPANLAGFANVLDAPLVRCASFEVHVYDSSAVVEH